MTKVLFVCLGNICRSPLAEGIFQKLIDESGLEDTISCDSCGTSSYHIGGQPDSRTQANAIENGVQLNHKARKFTAIDFDEFDYILPMDNSNLRNVKSFKEAGSSNAVIKLMREYDPNGRGEDVPDPYFGGDDGFQEVFDVLDRSCRELLAQLS